MPTKISVFRPARYWGCARKLKVKIDGVEVEPVKNKCTEEYEVSPGPHTVQIHMDWCSSAPFPVTVGEGETISLRGEVPDIFSMSGFWAAFAGPLIWPKTLFDIFMVPAQA